LTHRKTPYRRYHLLLDYQLLSLSVRSNERSDCLWKEWIGHQ
jgi:hypothetical protein